MIMMPKIEANILLICSFRYALGRKTYVTSEISGLMKNYIDIFNEKEINTFIKDITIAEKKDDIGHECDRKIWLELRQWLRDHESEIRGRQIDKSN